MVVVELDERLYYHNRKTCVPSIHAFDLWHFYRQGAVFTLQKQCGGDVTSFFATALNNAIIAHRNDELIGL
jgi:hypothetical protein